VQGVSITNKGAIDVDKGELWEIIKAIVEARGRRLVRYRYCEDFWDKLMSMDESKFLILRAPTGIGKTETFLSPFLHQFLIDEYRWESLIYVLPTRSLVNSMFKRILDAARVVLGNKIRLVVSRDHGGVIRNERTFLEGDIVITTYDTLFYTLYGIRSPGRHILLPLGKVATSLIVMDEVQLLQDTHWYAPSLLPYHIRTLLRIGAHVILMSATIPNTLISEIKDVCSVDPVIVDCKDEARRGKVTIHRVSGTILHNIDKFLEESILPALIVCNTVPQAVEVFRRIRESISTDVDVELLHSRLTLGTREKREEKISMFGDNDKFVLIATQVVEAGMDFNFKSLITEIAPIDALIQRIGRCARKAEVTGDVFLCESADEAEKVYPKDVISQTERILRDNANISKLERSIMRVLDAVELVDSVYTKDMISSLRKLVSEKVGEVRKFVSEFSALGLFKERKLIKQKYSEVLKQLVREGFEIRVVYIDSPHYSDIIKGLSQHDEVTIDGSELFPLENRIISLGLSRGNISERKESFPEALIYKISNEEFLVGISKIENQRIHLRKISTHEGLKYMLQSELMPLFLLNPEFYLTYDINGKFYDLGVVKL